MSTNNFWFVFSFCILSGWNRVSYKWMKQFSFCLSTLLHIRSLVLKNVENLRTQSVICSSLLLLFRGNETSRMTTNGFSWNGAEPYFCSDNKSITENNSEHLVDSNAGENNCQFLNNLYNIEESLWLLKFASIKLLREFVLRDSLIRIVD